MDVNNLFYSLQIEMPATEEVSRTNDPVYCATTDVVRAVMDMTRGVQQAKAEQYVDLVKVRLKLT